MSSCAILTCLVVKAWNRVPRLLRKLPISEAKNSPCFCPIQCYPVVLRWRCTPFPPRPSIYKPSLLSMRADLSVSGRRREFSSHDVHVIDYVVVQHVLLPLPPLLLKVSLHSHVSDAGTMRSPVPSIFIDTVLMVLMPVTALRPQSLSIW